MQPFIKWAGGKRQLLSKIKNRVLYCTPKVRQKNLTFGVQYNIRCGKTLILCVLLWANLHTFLLKLNYPPSSFYYNFKCSEQKEIATTVFYN